MEKEYLKLYNEWPPQGRGWEAGGKGNIVSNIAISFHGDR